MSDARERNKEREKHPQMSQKHDTWQCFVGGTIPWKQEPMETSSNPYTCEGVPYRGHMRNDRMLVALYVVAGGIDTVTHGC